MGAFSRLGWGWGGGGGGGGGGVSCPAAGKPSGGVKVILVGIVK